MKYTKAFTLTMLMIMGLYLATTPLHSVSKENNDLLFIIGLYDHQQYEMAKKQIHVFENEYNMSQYGDLVSFIKANIAFAEYRYSYADSIYSVLLNKKIDQTMLAETLVNKAYINYDRNENLKALQLLAQVEKSTSATELLFRIELLKGRIYSRIFNSVAAQESYERALIYNGKNASAISELIKSYISTENIAKAKALIYGIINDNSSLESIATPLNIWIDYLLTIEDYREIINLENEILLKKLPTPDSIVLRFAQTHILINELDEALKLLSNVYLYKSYRLFLTGLIYTQEGKDNQADSIFAELSSMQIPANDLLPDSNVDIAISSWLERIKILYRSSPDQAITYMNEYISENNVKDIDPNILYIYGSLMFKSKKYQEAASILLTVKNLDTTSALSRNIKIMLGDIWYDARILDKAKLAYNQYLNSYPHGRFRLHSLYNIAMIDFEQKDYQSSAAGLSLCLSLSEDDEIKEKSQFLLAEIDFYQANYNKAIRQYNQINNKYLNRSVIDYRIAQSLYYSEDYLAASEMIPALVIDSTNAFQVLLLEGNIYFNLNRYTEAMNTYNLSATYSKNDSESKEVSSYIALTLYRLKRFSEASQLYLKLSVDKESPQAYLIMAAKAAYHAKDYQQALMLFKNFITEHPESEFYNNALASIGSIYYNQVEYYKATQTWISLLKRYLNNKYFNDDEQVILQSAFSGLLWCLKQNPDQTALDEINDMIDSFKSEYIRFELQYLLLKVYYGTEQWGDLLQMADDLRKEFPHKENNEFRRFVAGSLSKLYRFNEADSVFQTMYKIEPTADILTEWADLEIISGKSDEAISKLDEAVELDKNSQRFVRLVQNVYEMKPDSLFFFWHKWESTFLPIPEKAQFIWLQWNYDNSNWALCDSLAENLLLSEELIIRSKAQLIKGIAKFHLNSFEDAILQLYKTIYLYADASDIVLDAKRYIVKSYIALGQIGEAKNVYDEIKDSLASDEQNDIENILNTEQQKDE